METVDIPPVDLLISCPRAYGVDCGGAQSSGGVEVGVRNGRIVSTDGRQQQAAIRRDYPGATLLPGLIDIHAHPALSGSVFGVPPDREMLPWGVTTVLSQGDCGADNLERYLQQTVMGSRTRICLALNLSRIGESSENGCLSELDNADVDACLAAIGHNRSSIWGVACNASRAACGANDPRTVVLRALQVADQSGLPMLYGMRQPDDWSFEEQMSLLRPGDVVTYCFRRVPHCIVQGDAVHPAIRDARNRGILFDVGHGAASFSFRVAERAIAAGFPPDTISTDLQCRHLGVQPRHTLPLVMSKLRAAGMTDEDLFAAVTRTPARALRLDAEIGALAAGCCADMTVLQWHEEPLDLYDTDGDCRNGGQWLPLQTIRAGELIPAP